MILSTELSSFFGKIGRETKMSVLERVPTMSDPEKI